MRWIRWFPWRYVIRQVARDRGFIDPVRILSRTHGGCVGDGQQAWAAAGWVLYLRNAFVREEPNRLILASGLPLARLAPGSSLGFGPAPTPFGPIEIAIEASDPAIDVRWNGAWRERTPEIEVRLLGAPSIFTALTQSHVTLKSPAAP